MNLRRAANLKDSGRPPLAAAAPRLAKTNADTRRIAPPASTAKRWGTLLPHSLLPPCGTALPLAARARCRGREESLRHHFHVAFRRLQDGMGRLRHKLDGTAHHRPYPTLPRPNSYVSPLGRRYRLGEYGSLLPYTWPYRTAFSTYACLRRSFLRARTAAILLAAGCRADLGFGAFHVRGR